MTSGDVLDSGSFQEDRRRILLVEEQTVAREGIKRLLQSDPWQEIVGVGTSSEALTKLQLERFELIVLDVVWRSEDGLRMISNIRRFRPSVPILVLSSQVEPTVVRAALRAGANGYITRYASLEILQAAVLCVSSGGFILDPLVANPIAASIRRLPETANETSRYRRQVILDGVRSGKTNKEIALFLNVSLSTMKNHLNKLFLEYGAKDRNSLLAALKGLRSTSTEATF